ncbi:EAL domain-containing protein [Pleionea litopenaei]|uniref:EAL domain-containing protein n=1 Tax=Pleionea litopenaei TaxID=3070815 RepID=A0AA51RV43_9GAMM|nr:EAL domain-containing protein [Pleionea sp. HL-JVS1]WMS88069.1 EAL domain-containing protein [Pleionea sp. HL-JVS1]
MPERLVVSPLNTPDKFNQNTIEAIHEDSFGFLWFATQGGLHFYDGRSLMLFTSQKTPSRYQSVGLVDDFVFDIESSVDGQLWVLSLNGISQLDRASMTFRPLVRFSESPLSGTPQSISYSEQLNALIVTSQSSLYRIDLNASKTKEPNRYELREDKQLSANGVQPVRQVNTPLERRVEVLIDRIRLFNPITQASRNLPIELNQVIAFQDIYIGTNNEGIYWLNQSLKITRSVAFNEPIDIRSILIDRNQTIWMTLEEGGILGFDSEQKSFRRYNSENSNLSDFSIRSFFLGEDGLIWIGTATKGAYIFNPDDHAFSYISINSGFENRKLSSIRGLSKRDNKLVLATDAGLLVKLMDSNKEVYFSEVPRALSVVYWKNSIWLIGTEDGLFAYDGNKNTVNKLEIKNFSQTFSTRSLLINNERLYIGTDRKGVLLVDLNGLKLIENINYSANPSNETLDMVLSMAMPNNQELWIGTIDGLNIVSLIDLSAKPLHAFDDFLIRDIAITDQGNVYLATHSGIVEITKSDIASYALEYQMLDSEKGLAASIIYGLVVDESGLWYSSNQGLGYFDFVSGSFLHSRNDLKLGQLEFNGASRTEDEEGIFFGGIEGITKISHKIVKRTYLKPSWITQVSFSDNFKKAVYFPSGNIALEPNENVVKVRFSATNFNPELAINFRYRVNQEPWNAISNQSEVVLGGLDAGDYEVDVEFKVDNSEWLSASNSLRFNIQPKFYESNTAKLIYALIICTFFLVIFIQELRRRKIQRKALLSVQSNEERLKLALQASEQGLWDWRADENKVVRFNIGHLFHFEGDASSFDFMDALIHEKDRANVQRERLRFIENKDEFDIQYRVRSEEARWSWIHDKGKVIEFDEDGNIRRAVGTYTDITHLKRAQLESVLSNEILQSMTEAVVVLDNEQKVSFVNPAFCRITGFSMDKIVGHSLNALRSSKHSKEFYVNLWVEIERAGSWFGEFWIQNSNSKDLLCSLEAFHIDDEELDEHLTVLIFSNITDKRVAEEKLSFLARYDSLTGLPNRNLFLDRLEHAIALAKRQEHSVGVLFIDLDGFKKVNDSFGHQTGDLLLKKTADMINQCVRDEDTLARLSGDEFLLIIEDYDEQSQLDLIAEKILDNLRKPITLNESQLVITCSIGIAEYPKDSDNVESLLKYADTAMYHAKNQGKNSYSFYQEEMHVDLVHRLNIENYLRDAVEKDELYVVFQPIINAQTHKVTAAEALIRWRHPQLGEVFPGDFIPLAEETGYIVGIGLYVMEQVCILLSDSDTDDLSISVNVSVRQLMDESFVVETRALLRKYGVRPQQLKIEITESLLMTNPRQAANILKSLKSMGLTISIDDFGTGYSSLSYLKRFAIDELKIDKEFISDINDERQEETIVNAIMAMAKSLNMKVVAEGVETQVQINYLARHQCDLLQGYYFSRPLERDAFIAYVASFNGS